MPCWDKSKKKWRGRVMVQGNSVSRLFRTKRAAGDWEVEERKRLKAKTGTVFLVEAANEYLDHTQEAFHPTTYKNKYRVLKGLISKLGDQPLFAITPRQILQYLQGAPTRSQFNRRRKELLAFFHWCIQFHQLMKNPVIMKRLPRDREPQRVPTDRDVVRIMAAANRWERNFVVAFLTTGARKGEVIRWTWTNDIDFEHSRVRLGTRKSRTGEIAYRWIDMGETLRRALEDQWVTRLPQSDYVFQNRNTRFKNLGHRFCDRRHFIKQLCARINRAEMKKENEDERDLIQPLSYHALRRWFTSVLARKGISLPALQRLLGHSRPSTTDRYVYSVSEDAQKAINLLDSLEVFNGREKEEALVEGAVLGSSGPNPHASTKDARRMNLSPAFIPTKK